MRTGAGYDDRRTRPRSELALGSAAVPGRNYPSKCASKSETRLLCGFLDLAAEPTRQDQLVAPTPLLRLSQARGHLRACQVFMHEIHVGTSVRI